MRAPRPDSSTLFSHYAPVLALLGVGAADAAQRAQLSPVYLAGAFAGLGIAIAIGRVALKGYGWLTGMVDAKIDARFTEHEKTSAAELGKLRAEIVGKVQELVGILDGRPCAIHAARERALKRDRLSVLEE